MKLASQLRVFGNLVTVGVAAVLFPLPAMANIDVTAFYLGGSGTSLDNVHGANGDFDSGQLEHNTFYFNNGYPTPGLVATHGTVLDAIPSFALYGMAFTTPNPNQYAPPAPFPAGPGLGAGAMWIAGDATGGPGTRMTLDATRSGLYLPADLWFTGGLLAGLLWFDPTTPNVSIHVKLEAAGDVLINTYLSPSGSGGFQTVNLAGVGSQHYGAIQGFEGSLEVDIYDGRAALYLPNSADVWAAVPEPATMLAGALLLLPFGASALRLLRKKQAA